MSLARFEPMNVMPVLSIIIYGSRRNVTIDRMQYMEILLIPAMSCWPVNLLSRRVMYAKAHFIDLKSVAGYDSCARSNSDSHVPPKCKLRKIVK